MSRGQRNDVDYFPHECNHGRKMHIIESKYGNDGYAVWFKLLEQLGKANYHFIDISDSMNFMFLSSIFKVKEAILKDILDTLAKLDAIDEELYKKHQIIYSKKFVNSIEDAYKKRISNVPTIQQIIKLSKKQSAAETHHSETETTEIKIKAIEKGHFSTIQAESIPKEEKSKEKKRKGEKNAGEKTPTPSLAYDFLKLEKPEAMNVFEMQHKKLVEDWGKLIKAFNNKIDLEIAQNKIEYEPEQLLPRFKGFTDAWIDNQTKYSKATEKNSYESGKTGRRF